MRELSSKSELRKNEAEIQKEAMEDKLRMHDRRVQRFEKDIERINKVLTSIRLSDTREDTREAMAIAAAEAEEELANAKNALDRELRQIEFEEKAGFHGGTTETSKRAIPQRRKTLEGSELGSGGESVTNHTQPSGGTNEEKKRQTPEEKEREYQRLASELAHSQEMVRQIDEILRDTEDEARALKEETSDTTSATTEDNKKLNTEERRQENNKRMARLEETMKEIDEIGTKKE